MFENNNLFATAKEYTPLAERMRPRNLEDFCGQNKIVGPDKYLSRLITKDSLQSIILYGPAGTGKTTLARIIAASTQDNFEKLNATIAGVGDIRQVVAKAQQLRQTYAKGTILFIDEIHRFNKAQQDILLPYIENGLLILIGATTENPYFELNSPLLSRAKIVRLEALSTEALERILQKALTDSTRGLGQYKLSIETECLRTLAEMANGDARAALNLLEQLFLIFGENATIRAQELQEALPEMLRKYDKNGDAHYNVISAFIKSMRGSDPDATLHYMARMLDAGESIEFIARRIVICASEDVGLADSQALVIATACMQAVKMLGLPEARIPLAHAACYVALAPKSNAAYLGIDLAMQDVRHKECGDVPNHLKDAHYAGAAKFGHGIGYKYPHDYPGAQVQQEYLPEKLRGTIYLKR